MGTHNGSGNGVMKGSPCAPTALTLILTLTHIMVSVTFNNKTLTLINTINIIYHINILIVVII
jgi:hypothetical protein